MCAMWCVLYISFRVIICVWLLIENTALSACTQKMYFWHVDRNSYDQICKEKCNTSDLACWSNMGIFICIQFFHCCRNRSCNSCFNLVFISELKWQMFSMLSDWDELISMVALLNVGLCVHTIPPSNRSAKCCFVSYI